MKGMILAAGYGTRLRPLTWLMPKPMVPLCNRPLLGWAIEAFLAADVRELIVNVHHLPGVIEPYLHSRNDFEWYLSVEDEILGTGGGVRRVRNRLEPDELFFLANADTVQFPRYAALGEALHATGSLAALTLRTPPDGDRFTAVWRDPASGLITGFGQGSGDALMFAGSHAISRRIFDYLPDREFSGIVEHVYQPLLQSRAETIGSLVDDGLWFDVGTPERYLSASAAVLSAIHRSEIAAPPGSQMSGNSLVHESTTVSGQLTRSVAGGGCSIAGDVRDSILWSDCMIGSDVTLDDCIIASGVRLDQSIHLRNVIICPDVPEIPPEYRRLDGLVIVSTAE